MFLRNNGEHAWMLPVIMLHEDLEVEAIYRGDGTAKKAQIKLIWCIQQKFRLQKVGEAADFLEVNFFTPDFDHFLDPSLQYIKLPHGLGAFRAKNFIWVKSNGQHSL